MVWRKTIQTVVAVALMVCLCAAPMNAVCAGEDPGCEPHWVPTFGGERGMNGTVYALLHFDDGTGDALYAGGAFTQAGLVAAEGIARWDGHAWSEVGGGLHGAVYCLTVFDDGSGPALYAGGLFSLGAGQFNINIAKWTGTEWTHVGAGPTGTIYALAAYDDGSGPALYAGGLFSQVGVHTVNNIAKWDGKEWSALGAGVLGTNAAVYALRVFDDGNEPALYVGGAFSNAGGVTAQRIARWNGAAFSTVGAGFTGTVYALEVYDDGNGAALFAAGRFSDSGGVAVNNIARLSPSRHWEPVGDGLTSSAQSTYNEVRALFTHTANGESVLYASGGFDQSGATPIHMVAQWDGAAWSQVGVQFNAGGKAYALGVYDDGSGGGEELYLGWDRTEIHITGLPYVTARRIMKCSNGLWQPLGQEVHPEIVTFHEFDDGTGDGPALYAAGRFVAIDGVLVSRVARWGGTAWESLNGALDGNVYALATATVDGMPALVAGGSIGAGQFSFGETYVTWWDGKAWRQLTTKLRNTESPAIPSILDLIEFDDGSGPALYAGGSITHAGDLPINHVARWNGKAWEPLGNGSETPVRAFCIFDNGNGPALYAAGLFHADEGINESRVGRWDGEKWIPVGTGTTGTIRSLVVFDDGTGPTLCAAGNPSFTGYNDIVKLVGTKWLTLGIATGGVGEFVTSLAVYDEGMGRGPQLYAAGDFKELNGIPVRAIARLDGEWWSSLDGEIGPGTFGDDPSISALAVFDDGHGPALCVGGDFLESPSGDSFVAMWRGCAAACPGDMVTSETFAGPPDGVVDSADLAFLLGAWGSNPGSPADLATSETFAPPPNGVVDGADLAALLGAWGPCD